VGSRDRELASVGAVGGLEPGTHLSTRVQKKRISAARRKKDPIERLGLH